MFVVFSIVALIHFRHQRRQDSYCWVMAMRISYFRRKPSSRIPQLLPRVKQWYLLMATRDPVNSPVEVKVVYPIIYRGFYTSEVVQDFWTINRRFFQRTHDSRRLWFFLFEVRTFLGETNYIKHWTWTVHLISNKIIRILWSCFETPLTCHFHPFPTWQTGSLAIAGIRFEAPCPCQRYWNGRWSSSITPHSGSMGKSWQKPCKIF